MNSSTEKWAVIINLKSGKRHFRTQMNFLFKSLDEAGIAYEHRITEFAGHAILIARHFARQKFRNFLVVGGDGTISEVINGIFDVHIAHAQDLRIAQIPRGTGNDWARFWGLSSDYKHAIQTFLQGKTLPIDIGKVEFELEGEKQTRFFINSIGFGLDAAVAHQANRLKKFVGSHSILYFFALLGAVFQYKPKMAKISNPEKDIEDYLFTMNIANGCYSGGGMKQNPDAVPWDGKLDLMMVRKPGFKDIITALPLIFNGKILQHQAIESFRSETIFLNTQNGNYFEADGIVVHYAPPVTISLLPGAIQMVIP
jgi:diacylglycerol kinase (ATP)